MRHQSELQEIIPVRVNRSPDLERKVSRGEEEDELDVKPNLNIWWVSQVSSTWMAGSRSLVFSSSEPSLGLCAKRQQGLRTRGSTVCEGMMSQKPAMR